MHRPNVDQRFGRPADQVHRRCRIPPLVGDHPQQMPRVRFLANRLPHPPIKGLGTIELACLVLRAGRALGRRDVDCAVAAQNSRPPFGTLKSGRTSTTASSLSGMPKVSTSLMNGPIWRGGKFTTAQTCRPMS